jgi:hypothetical protein
MTDFGSSLFKIQSGTASYADLISVLGGLVSDAQVRSRCSGLGSLVADMNESQRKSNCEAMVSVYFANFGSYLKSAPEEAGPFLATVALLAKCPPARHGPWSRHVSADADRKGRVTRAVLSTEVGDVIVALEQLWNVPGYLLVKR